MFLAVLFALAATGRADGGGPGAQRETTAAPLKLAMPGLRMVDLDANRGSFYSEHLALQMKRAGVDVLTEREIAAILGMERQKQLLGCTDAATGCVAEMASAMGTDGVLLGDVAKVGKSVQINLKIVSARDGKTLALFSERADSDEATVDTLTRGAVQLARDFSAALGTPLVPVASKEVTPSGGGLSRFWWAPVALGAVGVVVGAIFFGQAAGTSAQIRGATPGNPLLLADAQMLGAQGTTQQTLGGVSLGIGAALVAVGGALAIVHFTHGPAVAVALTDRGGWFALAGTWP